MVAMPGGPTGRRTPPGGVAAGGTLPGCAVPDRAPSGRAPDADGRVGCGCPRGGESPAHAGGDPRPVQAELGEDLLDVPLGDVGPSDAQHGDRRRDRPASSAPRRTSSARYIPAPPIRTPSSAVTTSRWAAASASMARSGGLTTRTSHTVASMPSAANRSAAVRQAATSFPTASRQTDPSPVRSRRASRSCPTSPGRIRGGGDFENRITEGPGSSSAVSSMTSTSSAEDGVNTVMPGIDRARARSSVPWWLGPLSPVIPARSSTNTTGNPWRPTSRLAWSKARQKKVE